MLTTHFLDEADLLCDRVVCFKPEALNPKPYTLNPKP